MRFRVSRREFMKTAAAVPLGTALARPAHGPAAYPIDSGPVVISFVATPLVESAPRESFSNAHEDLPHLSANLLRGC